MATIYVNESFTKFDDKKEEDIFPETDIKTDVYKSLQKTKDCELYQTIEKSKTNQEIDTKVISRKKIIYILLIFLSATAIGLIGVVILFASTTKTDGSWESWQMWTNCSTDCGGGFRTRSRTCPTPSHTGRYCQGESIDIESCENEKCDGSWENWQMWTNCSADCGSGFRTRSRTCSNPTPSHCGRHCQGNSIDIESCETETCVEIEDKRVWIGASDTSVEGTFVWIDGTTFSAFTYWRPGQPNSYLGNQDCVDLVNVDGKWKWSDNWCKEKRSSICEFN